MPGETLSIIGSVREVAEVERIAWQEGNLLLDRDRAKYTKMVRGSRLITFLPEATFGKATLYRASYYFIRHIDDVLDGDRNVGQDPLEYVRNLRTQIESDEFTGIPPISKLAEYSLKVLERNKKVDDNPRQDYLDAMDQMIIDHERAKTRQAFTMEQLEDYYYLAFKPVVNAMLIGFEAPFRAEDVKALCYCQGRLYSIKDLDKDWERGIINIPIEFLNAAGLTVNSDIKDVKSSRLLREWFGSQLKASKEDLTDLRKKLKNMVLIYHYCPA